MLQRLIGLETEYALRVTPQPGFAAQSNRTAAMAVIDAVAGRVRTLPGRPRLGRRRTFLQNGGSLYYEYHPTDMEGGLLEAATPECRGPAQVLLYQKAQERLLLEALPAASDALGAEVGLLRHCIDAEGHVYGVQENYEVDLARGARLWAWRAGLLVLLPVSLFNLFGVLALFTAIGLAMVAVLCLALLAAAVGLRRPLAWIEGAEDAATRAAMLLEHVLMWPTVQGTTGLARLFAFRRLRGDVEALLVSRVVLAGTGVVQPGGGFALSPRALAIRRRDRISALPDGRGIFDATHLVKLVMQPLMLDFRAPLALFRQRQRFQLGLSEAGRCQLGDYLAIGTAALIIDMSEAGALVDPPRLRRPVVALHAFAGTAGLATEAEGWTALRLQRWYLEAAQAWVDAHPAPAIEAIELLGTWRRVLDDLETDPGQLVGRIDWVTKRYLLETAGAGAEHAVLQKIDLRYHELGGGYLARLEQAGVAPTVVDSGQVARAIEQPPVDTPAHIRGRLVHRLAGGPASVAIDWQAVQLGGLLRGKVVRLADARARRLADGEGM